MIVVTFVVTAVAIVALAGLGLSGAVSTSQSKLEKKQELKYVVDGAAQLAASDLSSGLLTVGNSKTYYVGGVAVTVAATANPNLGNAANLSISGASGGMPISTATTVAYLPSVVDNLWSYGIFTNNTFTWPLLGSNKVVGSFYAKNSISVLSLGGQVTKDFKTSSSFNPLSLLSIGGGILTGIKPMGFPTVTSTDYTSNAQSTLQGNQVLNGYTFPSANAIVVVNGNLTIKGTVNGDGTFYVTGTITVNGNLARQSSSHHIVFVTPGSIVFSASGSISADGYYYAGTQITINSTLTTTGALTAGTFSVGAGFTVNWDNWLTKNTINGQSLHAPGMWP